VLDGAAPAVVLHLAWVASSTPGYRLDDRNERWAEATWLLVQECLRRGIWFIGTGSVVETAASRDPYTVAKSELRRRLDPLIDEGALTWLVPHYVYSIAEASPELVRLALSARDSGLPLVLGAPWRRHDFVDIDDVAQAVLAVLRNGLRGVVEIGAGTTRRALDLAAAIGADVAGARPSDPDEMSTPPADTTPLRAVGWSPCQTTAMFAPRDGRASSEPAVR
jgi:nucleoside-diphosphate-sugar epimerase